MAPSRSLCHEVLCTGVPATGYGVFQTSLEKRNGSKTQNEPWRHQYEPSNHGFGIFCSHSGSQLDGLIVTFQIGTWRIPSELVVFRDLVEHALHESQAFIMPALSSQIVGKVGSEDRRLRLEFYGFSENLFRHLFSVLMVQCPSES